MLSRGLCLLPRGPLDSKPNAERGRGAESNFHSGSLKRSPVPGFGGVILFFIFLFGFVGLLFLFVWFFVFLVVLLFVLFFSWWGFKKKKLNCSRLLNAAP